MLLCVCAFYVSRVPVVNQLLHTVLLVQKPRMVTGFLATATCSFGTLEILWRVGPEFDSRHSSQKLSSIQ